MPRTPFKCLQKLASDPRTLIYYEAPHRILRCLEDMLEVFGEARQLCVAREITKMYESIRHGSVGEMVDWYRDNEEQQRGEVVIVVQGNQEPIETDTEELRHLLGLLLASCSLKDATTLAAQISGLAKNSVYKIALEIQKNRDD